MRCWTRSLPGRLDERVLDRIVSESRGNPLTLLELARGVAPAELAGGFALPDVMPVGEPYRAELRANARVASRSKPGGCC